MPAPTRMHHIVEDFLTQWTAPRVHFTPLRRFIEACTGRDLRSRHARDCYAMALTHKNLPLGCEGYEAWEEGQGLFMEQEWLRANERVIAEPVREHRKM